MSPQLIRETRPVARKSHRCSMCTGPIHPGEQYERDTLVYDNHVYDWLTCSGCSIDKVYSHVVNWVGDWYDDGFVSDDAYEWASEMALHSDDVVTMSAARRFLNRWYGRST